MNDRIPTWQAFCSAVFHSRTTFDWCGRILRSLERVSQPVMHLLEPLKRVRPQEPLVHSVLDSLGVSLEVLLGTRG